VHPCSAGVGRTGCYVALDTLLQHVEEHDFIDVFGLVSEMRQHRNHMIQTEAQYVFVHKAMVEFIDTHYTGKSPTRFGTYPSLYTNNFAEDSTQMTDYYGDFLSEETHM
ncbi:Receptor-type tyrosine-protein phosphatase O, partial [Geodia barretti]